MVIGQVTDVNYVSKIHKAKVVNQKGLVWCNPETHFQDTSTYKNWNQKLQPPKLTKKMDFVFLCIVKASMEVYVKYKSNPMNSYWEITTQRNFKQKLQPQKFQNKF